MVNRSFAGMKEGAYMFGGFNYTVRGQSHIASGKVCQDWSDFRKRKNYAVAVVADGHGSKKHFRSDIGSKLAVNITLRTIDDFYRNPDEFELSFLKNPEKIIIKIQKYIISYWNHEIIRYHRSHPVTAEEKSIFTDDEFSRIRTESIYGTTLVAAVCGRKFSFGIQIGDGSLVVINRNCIAEMPIDGDENPANITSSMCNSNAIDMFSFFYTFENPLAMFVSTDGLYTSFGSTEDFLDYHTIIAGQLDNYEDFRDIVLRNITKRTKYGTQDDISFSCVFDRNLIKENIIEVRKQIQINNSRSALRREEHEARIRKMKIQTAYRKNG